jgi:hypothetical protein
MRKLIFGLVAPFFLSVVAATAAGAAPPVAPGAIPSGYVWYSGGLVAVGIGYTDQSIGSRGQLFGSYRRHDIH